MSWTPYVFRPAAVSLPEPLRRADEALQARCDKLAADEARAAAALDSARSESLTNLAIGNTGGHARALLVQTIQDRGALLTDLRGHCDAVAKAVTDMQADAHSAIVEAERRAEEQLRALGYVPSTPDNLGTPGRMTSFREAVLCHPRVVAERERRESLRVSDINSSHKWNYLAIVEAAIDELNARTEDARRRILAAGVA